ncbi:TetR family transcriptional regulator [Sphingobium boeckii]|uniref:AcrR family transcriptional regulator n=1 Tax=Sphingobium boeckii TaxID=1082345 RepID=A0A7W9AIA4_9SPHN|nr:AcrR family transcriptional regulator [Sphingobium boeckii]
MRRAEIVGAAIRLVGARGYYGMTVQMLAESCNLTKAGWLHYFASKDDMLAELLDELERRDTALLAPIVTAGMAGDAAAKRAALMTLLDTIITRFIDCPDIGRFALVLQGEAIDPDHPAHARFRDREAVALQVYATLLTPTSPRPALTARMLHALMTGLAQQWLRAARTFDLLATWREASEAMLPGARPPPTEPHLRHD